MQFAVMRLATLDFQIREVPTEIPRNVFKSNADYPDKTAFKLFLDKPCHRSSCN